MTPYFSFIHEMIVPEKILIIGLFSLMILDLVTGIMKSTSMGIATRSKGIKKTTLKFNTYSTMIILALIITNLVHFYYGDDSDFKLLFAINTVVSYLIHSEVKSVLENLILMNTDSDGNRNDVAKFLIPIHNAIILKLKNMSDFNYKETKEELIKKITNE